MELASTAGPESSPVVKKRRIWVEHKVPGRIRMKVASLKVGPHVLDVCKSAFSGIPGITEIKLTPATGSIVIRYDPKCDAEFCDNFHLACTENHMSVAPYLPGDEIEEIARKIKAEAEFLAQRSKLSKTTVDLCKTLDRELKFLTGNAVDLKIALAGGLAVYTFMVIGAGAATPMWVTLALFSLNHLGEQQGAWPAPTAPAAATS